MTSTSDVSMASLMIEVDSTGMADSSSLSDVYSTEMRSMRRSGACSETCTGLTFGLLSSLSFPSRFLKRDVCFAGTDRPNVAKESEISVSKNTGGCEDDNALLA